MVSARRKKLKLLVRLWKEAHLKGRAYTFQEVHYRGNLRHKKGFTTVNGAVAGTIAGVGAILYGKSECNDSVMNLGILLTLVVLGYSVSLVDGLEGAFGWYAKARDSHRAAKNWDEVDQQIDFFFTEDLSDDNEVKAFANLMNERVFDLKADSCTLEIGFSEKARAQIKDEPPRNLYNGNGSNGNASNGNGASGSSDSNGNGHHKKCIRRQPTLPSLVQRRNRKNGIMEDLDLDNCVIEVDDLLSDDASEDDDDYQ